MIGYAVLGGFVLDTVFGDPAWLPHPVVYIKTEIRRQYPELELGPSFTRDEGEKEVGGEIGFNLPLWNRNRKAIAEARGTRDLSRQETIQL